MDTTCYVLLHTSDILGSWDIMVFRALILGHPGFGASHLVPPKLDPWDLDHLGSRPISSRASHLGPCCMHHDQDDTSVWSIHTHHAAHVSTCCVHVVTCTYPGMRSRGWILHVTCCCVLGTSWDTLGSRYLMMFRAVGVLVQSKQMFRRTV